MSYVEPVDSVVPGESSFLNRVSDAFGQQWMGQLSRVARRSGQAWDPDYKARNDPLNAGYEDYMGELARAANADDAAMIRRHIDQSLAAEARLGRHGAFMPHLVAAMGDPMSWLAGPAFKGVGFTQGLLRGAATAGALNAPPELAAAALDPVRTAGDAALPIFAGSLFGGVLGGLYGAFGRKGLTVEEAYQTAVGDAAGVRIEEMGGTTPRAPAQADGEDVEVPDMVGPVPVLPVARGSTLTPGGLEPGVRYDRETGIAAVDETRLREMWAADNDGFEAFSEYRAYRVRLSTLTELIPYDDWDGLGGFKYLDQVARRPDRWLNEAARHGMDFAELGGYRSTRIGLEDLWGNTQQYPLQHLRAIGRRLNLPGLGYLGDQIATDFLTPSSPIGTLRPGRSIETNARRWNPAVVRVEETFRSMYMQHIGEGPQSGVFKYMWKTWPQYFDTQRLDALGAADRLPDGTMSVREFGESVSRSVWDIDEYNAAIPEVKAAADSIVDLMNKFNDELRAAGVVEADSYDQLVGFEKTIRDLEARIENEGDPEGLLAFDLDVARKARDRAETALEYQTRPSRRGLRFDDRSYFMRLFDPERMASKERAAQFQEVVAQHYMATARFHRYYRMLQAELREAVEEGDTLRAEQIQEAMDYWLSREGAVGRAKTLYDEVMRESENPDRIFDKALQPSKPPEEPLWSRGTMQWLARTDLDIPTRELFPFLELDPIKLTRLYTRRMAPRLELSKVFGDDWRLEGRIAEVRGEIRAAGKAAGLGRKEITDLERAAQSSIENLRDMVLGIYGMPNTPNALGQVALRIARNWGSLAFMGRPYTVLADIGSMVMRQGFRPVAKQLGLRLSEMVDRNTLDTLGKDREVLREAFEMELGNWNAVSGQVTADLSRGAELADVGTAELTRAGGSLLDRVERQTANANGVLFYLNLMNPVTAGLKRISWHMTMDRMITASRRWVATGKVAKADADAFAAAGMTKQDARILVEQYDKHGEKPGASQLPNMDRWDTDPDTMVAAERIHNALFIASNSMVPTPSIANTPLFIRKPVAATLLQFSRFPLMATQIITTWGLQRRDRAVAAGMLTAIAIGYVINSIKTPDMVDQSPAEALMAAIDVSGVTGYLMDVNNMLENVSRGTLGLRPMLGLDPRFGEKTWADQVGTAGPVAGILGNLAWAFFDDEATGHDKGNAIRWATPLNNWYLTYPLFRSIQAAAEAGLGVDE